MATGLHRTKTGELVYVSVTVDGHYMIKYSDGRVTFI